jgi:hypothetical protein
MFKKEIKKTDNFVEGIGFIEEVFEMLADKQTEKLTFEIEKEIKNEKTDILIKINTTDGKRRKK